MLLRIRRLEYAYQRMDGQVRHAITTYGVITTLKSGPKTPKRY